MSLDKIFTDMSNPGSSGPITAWDMDFGDGSTHGTGPGPWTHDYASSGVVTTVLKVTGTSPDGTASISKQELVTNPGALTALFTFVVNGLSVTVYNASTPGPSGPITAWDLDWGDSSTHATGPGPWSHTYASGNTYTVVLGITGTSPDGTSSLSQSVAATGSTVFGIWEWDAGSATVDPSSASKITAFLGYAGASVYGAANIAVGNVSAHTGPVYSVSAAGKPGAGGNLDSTIWFPNGVLPSIFNDHQLSITDTVTGHWTDMELYQAGVNPPSNYYSGGKVTGWTGAVSENIGAAQAPGAPGHGNNSATAAGLPLQQGAITAADVASGVIAHTLVFRCDQPGPSPNPYPASSQVGYPANTGHIPIGTWLRLNPSYVLPNSLTTFEKMICVALQTYGMILVGQSGASLISFNLTDVGGGGNGFAAYAAHGVTIPSNGTLRLSGITATVLGHLQVLDPPSP